MRPASRKNGSRIAAAVARAFPTARMSPPCRPPRAGMSTIRTTTARSSTSVIPIITRPWRERSSPRSSSSRARTIVLATDTTIPTIAPSSRLQPRAAAVASPSAMDRTMPSGPPRTATHFTRRRSFSENSIPSENIRSTTPISAKSSKV